MKKSRAQKDILPIRQGWAEIKGCIRVPTAHAQNCYSRFIIMYIGAMKMNFEDQ